MRLEVFYNLLVKEITEGGGITASDKPEQTSGFMENRKDVLELSQKFSGKTNFFFSYVFRSILEILLAAGLLVFLCIVGLPTVLDVSISDISINDFNKAQNNFIISLKPSSHCFYLLFRTFICIVMFTGFHTNVPGILSSFILF